ncbi:MAG: hypothetical protein U0794_06350 [Isosphaeraceae bacterium]
MSSTSLPANKPKPRSSGDGRASENQPPVLSTGLRALDALLLLAFLALTFLLGVFLLKDTDYWWHLRTGDLIRETRIVPRVDLFTFGAEGRPWIDLHWLFQVVVSWLHERGGVPALTLAKCFVTTFAVFLLVTARRPEWPLWTMLLAWLPALMVLGGRMYVRPETLTLLYLSIDLAVLFRIERRPWLAFVVPLVQVAWVNTQGLFVFGPILWVFALLDAALRPGAFAPGRLGWWRRVGLAAFLTGLACLVNPYGLHGALYPLELASTMGNPVFSLKIAELTPIPEFIRRDGLISLPLRLQLLTLLIGGLSFLVPLTWVVWKRLTAPAEPELVVVEPRGKARGESTRGVKVSRPRKKASTRQVDPTASGWRLSVFRLFLFASFSLLSFQATRNSHQFAAVVGTVTAWNLGEWGAALRRSRRQESAAAAHPSTGAGPRLLVLSAIGATFVWVATGSFYQATREGRVIGLGEQPLWYPHDAVKFAGSAGMPDRYLTFHIGHASLFDYYHGPERKVYVDARLEVIGADLFERYMALQESIASNSPSWTRELDALGRPLVLADNDLNASIAATLITSNDWRCVWFDPIASVFVHVAHDQAVRAHQVDFGARHFRPDPATTPVGAPALLASAKGLRNIVSLVPTASPDRVRPLIALGQDYARRYQSSVPTAADGWKMFGQLEMLREPASVDPVPRFRAPFDPVFDLSAVRSTYALKRASELAPDDFSTLLMLSRSFESRAMTEAMIPVLDQMVGLTPINGIQARSQATTALKLASLRASLGPPPSESWQNLNELAKTVSELLANGRPSTAAAFLEKAAPAESRPWEETDRIATLYLHLGEPAHARATWEAAPRPPQPALRLARIALTHLVEGDFEAARKGYRDAIASDPSLFEALYGLAVLEQDDGRASDALNAAGRALATAPHDVARSATQAVIAFVTPYAIPPVATEN